MVPLSSRSLSCCTSVGGLACAVALACLVQACGVTVGRPDLGYYFSNPVLNEDWTPRLLKEGSREKGSKSARGKSKKKSVTAVAAGKKSGDKHAGTEEAGGAAAAAAGSESLSQPLRGNDAEVVRREVVLSAVRLLGIRDSFTSDTFARHVVVVNNLGLGDPPAEGVVQWVRAKSGGDNVRAGQYRVGDFLFFGESEAEMLAVVESVEEDGVLTFIGLVNGEVQRGQVCPGRKNVRRDETSGKVMNSFVEHATLAGELLLGSAGVEDYATRVAGAEP